MIVALVTGSRHSTPELLREVKEALDEAKPDWLILGDCPSGADYFAYQWARARGVDFETRTARWTGRGAGDRAGPERNQRMVDSAVRMRDAGSTVLVLAFPRGGPGTRDCMRRARAAGLEVYEL